MMGNLNKKLEVIEQSLKANLPDKVFHNIQQSIEDVQQLSNVSGLQVGENVPDFVLQDAVGTKIHLYHELAKGPIILTFYRGGWCPFCNLQLRAYQEILPKIQELGANLIAISPQNPDNTLSQKEKEQLTFHVLSDTEGLVASQFKLLFDVQDSLKSVLEGFGGNLEEYNSMERWVLPVPATFVVDCQGVIRFSHIDPNFMRRVEPEDVLKVLETL
ncbi:AhpC/TSA family protein [Paenibacillus sp. KQZ6P-2]|uniref:thioredoxin-dependent peroxiredoxin n=1 Tax=Paenibacillus mangrovi TaxID=2931978 RepID=A0A9X2B865_9BACL|nr:peroxiredoxin-like family protein [Paenibacillus mangrovi]MCJ8014148.1 AhpC/TSA family protein [Paenibacillus mangrovi]